MLVQLVDEIVTLNKAYPITYQIFCLVVNFMISTLYNVYRKSNVPILGIFLSSIFSYTILYFSMRYLISNANKPTNDIPLILNALIGFISVDIFSKFNPFAVSNFLISLVIKRLESMTGYKPTNNNNLEKGGNESETDKRPLENNSNEAGYKERTPGGGYRRTK